MKVIERKSMWKGKFIETVMISYEDRHGHVRKWEAVDRINSAGVVVVIPVTDGKELVLIRQYRPALDRYVIELPAGLVESGEDYVEAGKRELIEETGYAAGAVSLLTEGVVSTGINAEMWKIVLALDVKEVPEEVLADHPSDDNEDIEVIKTPLESVYETLESYKDNGDVIDLRIFGLLELARRKMK